MKKLIMLALLVAAGSVFNTASAQSKKKEKQNTKCPVECKEGTVVLTSPSDTLSYAAGMSMTRGLDEYLANQFGVTSAQMPDFLRGLRQGIANRKDSAFAAYVAGLLISSQVDKTMLPNIASKFEGTSAPINPDLLYKGFVAALAKDSTVLKQATAEQIFEKKEVELKAQKDAEIKAKNEAYLEENKKKEGVVTMPNGLQYRIIKKGDGPIPTEADRVQVIYEGKTIDGKVFDATSRHGVEFDTFNVGGLIKGWTEALQMMPVGSKWEIVIPQHLAYGERGAGRDIGPFSTLIFTLELKGIEAAPEKETKVIDAAKLVPAKKVPAQKAKKNVKK
ncbi:FKBP-type peptidyl-prolyl cis-trans isomerase [Prevotella sp.]